MQKLWSPFSIILQIAEKQNNLFLNQSEIISFAFCIIEENKNCYL